MPPGIGYGQRIGIRPLYDRMTPEEQAIIDGLAQEQAQRIGVQIPAVPDVPLPFNGPGIEYGAPGTVFRNEGGAGLPQIRSDRQYFAPGTLPPEPDFEWEVSEADELRHQQALDSAGISAANRIPNPKAFSTGQEMAIRDKFDQELRTSPEYETFRDRRVNREEEEAARRALITKNARERDMTPRNLMLQLVGGGGLDNPMVAGMVGGPDAAKVALGMKQIEGQADEGQKNRAMELTKAGLLAKERLSQEQAATNAQIEQERRKYVIDNRNRPPDVVAQESEQIFGPEFPGGDQPAIPQLGNIPQSAPTRIGLQMNPVQKQLSERLHSSLNSSDPVAPQAFFGPGGFRADELLAQPSITRQYADQIRSRFGMEELLKALGGEFNPIGQMPRSESYDAMRRTNQQNLLRQLLGVPMFKPVPAPSLPVDDYEYGFAFM